ncbi:hypothetical protein [Pseudomonas sp. TCU-HL1]|uniref:hypothetical protein n=1 Tax=Pseudomonas sp. TCU-HL1 TaxID=1856685 RepID=UPI000857E4D6|nr:hypothetical protein [Pseudomonas sp. TCU-HL1]AOE85228.1 hypothetical protein THL1_2680 [Pseudomonas sp. TCU-HL1]
MKVVIADAYNLTGMNSIKNLKSFLTSIAFSLTGIAVHANAATENHRSASGICFQLTPLGSKRALPQSAQEGSSSDPLGN